MFSLIDGRPDEPVPAWGGEEAESGRGPASDGSDMGSATVSYADSLLREDCGGVCEEESAMRAFSGRVPDVLLGSPERVGVRMESERFQSATDVLARHYGLLKGQNKMEAGEPKKKITYSFIDDEDEIKV